MQTGVGLSHAKIILIGEHAVVYGQPAIALPIFAVQAKVTVTVDEHLAEPQIQSAYYTGPLSQAFGQMKGIQYLIEQLWQRFNDRQVPFQLTIDSQLPPERGMGSSAATAIAIIRGLADCFNQPIDHQQLLKFATLSENMIHGNPSGIDAATTGATTPLWYVKGQQPQPLPINLNGYLVIADSGQKGQTGTAVQSVQNRLLGNPAQTQPVIDHLGQLTTAVAANIAHNQLSELGQNLTAAQTDLQALGVSNQRLDRLITIANQAGSLGTKLTGGGRGGCIIALADTQSAANYLAQTLTNAGAIQTWIQALPDLQN
ncbi:mevalonate kinase [Latilactobacillus fuchuensis]|uniref:Mevalonate kinase n=2 Tax=Latilactobacillus fuchuensis TaxID=164393 RepID=A0A2N9DVC8_9LACO|nr:mevalonate kinase [Latilactobacillus fuchuensis]KRL62105.1 mevalonate kinase [Latilactobacillus fuchuensis DSM 14340 = JCM 11249]MCP8856964.1 mevalonate kinase [Latilactobacillus fuchuensis]SPC38417.1 Mevalonate kinase [Latilactobacillus fuchuensis]